MFLKTPKTIRKLFEHKWLNRILGSNLAFAVMATSVFQIPTSYFQVSNSIKQEAPQMILKAEKAAFITQKGIGYPLQEAQINQKFTAYHPGVDFEGVTGDEVYAVMGGKVQQIQHSKFGYGNAVIVSHGDGITSLYAHLSKIQVSHGQEVSKGSVIGKVGSTGFSTGDHLHFELREEDRPINPLVVLPK